MVYCAVDAMACSRRAMLMVGMGFFVMRWAHGDKFDGLYRFG